MQPRALALAVIGAVLLPLAGLASADAQVQQQVSQPIAPVPSVHPAIANEHARLWTLTPASGRAKLAAAAHRLAFEVDVQIRAAKMSGAKVDPEAIARKVEGEPGQAPSPLDLGKLSVEDAVMLVMMLCEKDAREDLRGILSDMERLAKRKEALREAMQKEKEREAKLKEELRERENEAAALERRAQVLRERRAKLLEALSRLRRLSPDGGAPAAQ